MRKLHTIQIIISGFIFTIVSQIFNILGAILTMQYYTNPAYFSLWSKLMMPSNGPPGVDFYLASIAIGLINGIIFASAYYLLNQSIPGKGISKGLNYGILLFLMVGIPFTLTIHLLLAVPAMLLLNWAISGLIIYLISGVAFSKIITGNE